MNSFLLIRKLRPRRADRGFSLIEVLVSMFIVSLGILALAGLMQASSRYGKTSELRSSATLLANDIADHIRANPGATLQTSTTSAYELTAAYSSSASLGAPTPANCTLPTVCLADQLALVDQYNWFQRLKATLPGGDAYIKYTPAPSATSAQRGSMDVWIAWTDPVSSTAANERPATECPDGLSVGSNYAVRCLYIQVGL